LDPDDPAVIAAISLVRKRNVSEGGTFYLDELRRREAARAEAASYMLAKRVYVLTWVNGIFAALAAGAAVLALFMR
jgi:hypothetical protein